MRRREEELQKKRDEKRRVEEEVSFSQWIGGTFGKGKSPYLMGNRWL